MKLIGAGFGRTGTLTLKAALERLGFGPCYHMTELKEHPEHAKLWRAAHDGELDSWDALFAGYQSTTDWPGCTFWPELMATYPDAKVLLSVRDADRWYDSVEKSVLPSLRMAQDLLRKGTVPDLPPGVPVEGFRDVLGPIVRDTFDYRVDDRAYAIEVFHRHNQKVRDSVPAERLLEYEVEQGWEPLCQFLEVPVPDEPFPHLNDSETMAKEMKRAQAERTGETA